MQIPLPQYEFIRAPNCQVKQIQELGVVVPNKIHRGITYDNRLGQVFPPHFVMVILGKPGAGKSQLLTNLLTRKQFLANKFDRILYLTPTDLKGITHSPVNTYRMMQVKWINNKINQCYKWARNILVVIDDLVSQIPMTQRNDFQQLLFNRLHKLRKPQNTVSFIITTQKYTSIPTYVRTCMNVLITFPTPQPQVKKIKQQVNTGKTKKTLDYLFELLKKPHFYVINIQLGQMFDDKFIKI